jgi:hypothetical protein
LATPNALLFSISVCLCGVASQTEENFMQRFYFWGANFRQIWSLKNIDFEQCQKFTRFGRSF